ncbi:MAG: signal peptidase II, partial [Ignavibacteriaceae bacterium]
FQGNVVDFLDVKFFKFFLFGHIPGNYVFNFADLSITVGVGILIYLIIKSKKEEKEKTLVRHYAEERQDSL